MEYCTSWQKSTESAIKADNYKIGHPVQRFLRKVYNRSYLFPSSCSQRCKSEVKIRYLVTDQELVLMSGHDVEVIVFPPSVVSN